MTTSEFEERPAEFNKTALNAYLGGTSAADWDSLASAVQGTSGAAAESAATEALPAVNLFGLLQVDPQGDNEELVADRGQEVQAELDRLASGTGRQRAAAQKVVAGLKALAQANSAWTLDNPQLYKLAHTAWLENINTGTYAAADELEERFSDFPLISRKEAARPIRYRGLPEDTALGLLKPLMANRSITVVDDIPAMLFSQIARTFPQGFAHAIHPRAFDEDADATISLLEQKVSGTSGPVTKADLDAALEYFTRNPQKYGQQKLLASRLTSQIKSDEQLRNWLASYYLQVFEDEQDRGATVSQAAETLRGLGVDSAEVDKLEAAFGGVSKLTAEWADPEVSEERARKLDKEAFGSLQRVMDDGRLAQAKYQLDQMLASGEKPRSSVGADIVESINSRARQLDRDTSSLEQAIQARNPIAARTELDAIAEYCVDSRAVGELATQVAEMEHDPVFVDQVLSTHFQPVADEGQNKALGFLPPKFSNPWITPLVLGIPAALLDIAVWDPNPATAIIGIVVLAIAAVFLEEYVDADGCVGWAVLLGPAVLALFTSGLFGAIAVGATQFASRTIFENRKKQKAADAFNKLIQAADLELKRTGMGAPVAGLYLGSERIVPPLKPTRRGTGEGLYLVTDNGVTSSEISSLTLAQMAHGGQFAGRNTWIAQKELEQ